MNTVLQSLNEYYPLENSEAQAFGRDGHLVLRGVASPEAIAEYRPHILETADEQIRNFPPMAERSTLGKAFIQVWHLNERNARVNEFVTARRFAKIAADIMGVDCVRLYHDQVLFKEPGGIGTPWHQDQFYIPLDTTKVLTMWMPLVDVTPEMGTMDFVSTSHREGDYAHLPTDEKSDALFEPLIEKRGWPVVPTGPMRAGDASFHSGWTIHRAQANNSAAMREVLTILYYADGARIKSDLNDMERGITGIHISGRGAGELADGEMNPVVFRR
jgi:ectoine hydroxylase-related dioxygenase (phytanoyl-CoA dioxygenase family)